MKQNKGIMDLYNGLNRTFKIPRPLNSDPYLFDKQGQPMTYENMFESRVSFYSYKLEGSTNLEVEGKSDNFTIDVENTILIYLNKLLQKYKQDYSFLNRKTLSMLIRGTRVCELVMPLIPVTATNTAETILPVVVSKAIRDIIFGNTSASTVSIWGKVEIFRFIDKSVM